MYFFQAIVLSSIENANFLAYFVAKDEIFKAFGTPAKNFRLSPTLIVACGSTAFLGLFFTKVGVGGQGGIPNANVSKSCRKFTHLMVYFYMPK